MIKRDILPSLIAHLNEKEITLIVGPRQAGKTTVMLVLKEYLEKKGKKTVFLSLDNDSDRHYFKSQATLHNFIKLQLGKSYGYVFIDEIQRQENAGLFLKGLYDQNLPYKLIVSGSGSLELKEKIHESLAGRKRIFELNTISFKEFVHYETAYQYEDRLHDFFVHDLHNPLALLEKYLQFGGYPKVVTDESYEAKTQSIAEIYTSYIEKDIKDLLNVQKSELFTNLVTILASQVGQLTNHNELASTLGLDRETLKNYLWYLDKTFIIRKVTPFYKNVRKELTKSPLYYFLDIGLRNYALNRLTQFNLLTEGGYMFQNFIFRLLAEIPHTKLHMWRTKGGAEVDFVVTAGIKAVPYEAKYKEITEPNLSKSILSYIDQYRPNRFYIVNKSYKKMLTIAETEVHFIPYFELLGNGIVF